MRPGLIATLAVCTLSATATAQQALFSPERLTTPLVTGALLAPTDHPRLPLVAEHLWLAPDLARPSGSTATIAAGLKLLDRANAAEAVSVLAQASHEPGVLAPYGLLALARAQLATGRHAEGLRTIRLLQQREPVGYVREALALAEGEALEAAGDLPSAMTVYDRLSRSKPAAVDEVLMRLGRVAERAGETSKAADAYTRVYSEWPLGEHAPVAKAKLDGLGAAVTSMPGARAKADLARGQRLFEAKQYGPAHAAFTAAAAAATGGDRELATLRIAQCDYHARRYRISRDALAGRLSAGPHQAEALYYFALATRALGDHATYLKLVRRLADEFSSQPWAEEALNDLATRYVRGDEDAAADGVYRELAERYPRGRFTERAVWKVGWRAFDAGRYDETAELFDRAAAHFPRSDFRPAWLFWSGRAHAQAGRQSIAESRFALTASDYLNSYYGRLAVARLDGQKPEPRIVAPTPGPPVPPPPNDAVVRALLEIQRYEDALNEVRYAQRHWGDSALLQATTAWIYRQQGQTVSGREQFNLLRGSITLMRRAYPQFMAAGGELLPREVLSVIFPVLYWDLIQKHAAARSLDPYLVAALVAQESTFVPDIRSSANAVGLMQLIPSTARIYARKLGLKYSSSLLVDPESNIRMGTAYLADKMQEFGHVHLALASYNAGEGSVRRWLATRQGRPHDQFVDDIPYPETQNYVKRILGTQDDYRRLYSGGLTGTVTHAGPRPDAADAALRPASDRADASDGSKPRAQTQPASTATRRPTTKPARRAGSAPGKKTTTVTR